jgi:hypothetical protein
MVERTMEKRYWRFICRHPAIQTSAVNLWLDSPLRFVFSAAGIFILEKNTNPG